MANNQLCGIDSRGRGTYTAEGITKLCQALKGSAVTSLECAAARMLAILLTPADTSAPASAPYPRSLHFNELGPEGGAALAEVVKGNSTLRSLE